MTKEGDTYATGSCTSSPLQTPSQDIHDDDADADANAEALKEVQAEADGYTEAHDHTDVNADAHNQADAVLSGMQQCDGLDQEQEQEIKQIVERTLQQMPEACQYLDVETIISLVVPKVLYDLQPYDRLQDEVRNIKHTLNSCMKQSKILADDIVEMYLDLHNIYTKLDKLDKNSKAKPVKCLQEAENSVDQP